MKFEKLNKTVESVWGSDWRTSIIEDWPEGRTGGAGRRALAAALVIRMGEMSASDAFKFYLSKKGSTYDHAKRCVEAALDGDSRWLVRGLHSATGDDVCTVGRLLKKVGAVQPHIDVDVNLMDAKGDLLRQIFELCDSTSQAEWLKSVPNSMLELIRKQQLARLHPDTGGTHEEMARFNHLWTALKKQREEL